MSESLQNDVVAAAKALDAVAAAGGAARLEINKDGGTSLVIQVTNDNKGKIMNAQSAIKTLTSNSALKAANEKEELARKARIVEREKNMTSLMRIARDDKDGKEMKTKIKALKAKNGSEMFVNLLNEKEEPLVEDDMEEQEKVNNESGGEKGGDDKIDGMDDTKVESDAREEPADGDSTEKFSNLLKDPKTLLSGSNNQPKDGEWAAIHFACDSGNYEALRFLLEAGADPNLTERMGATPLHRVILGAGKFPLTKSGKKDEGGDLNTTPLQSSPGKGKKGSGGDAAKMALPGVVKSKPSSSGNSSVGIGNIMNKNDNPIDMAYLEDYKKCLKLLLDNDRFDFMANERRDEECRGSEKKAATLDNMTINEKRSVGKAGLSRGNILVAYPKIRPLFLTMYSVAPRFFTLSFF